LLYARDFAEDCAPSESKALLQFQTSLHDSHYFGLRAAISVLILDISLMQVLLTSC
jgi:hypothetical protein